MKNYYFVSLLVLTSLVTSCAEHRGRNSNVKEGDICQSPANCPDDMDCVSGYCRLKCSHDKDCGLGRICLDGICQNDSTTDENAPTWIECFNVTCIDKKCTYTPKKGSNPCGNRCINGTFYELGECIENGQNCSGKPTSCNGYDCNTDGQHCLTECSADENCQENYYCKDHSCQPKLIDGSSCDLEQNGRECLGGHCDQVPSTNNSICCEDDECCLNSADCTAPNTCNSTIFTCQEDSSSDSDTDKLPTGESCTKDENCLSGHCVDFTCCTSSTCGTCQNCSTGNCTDIANGISDLDTCNDPTRACDGHGHCDLINGQDCSTDTACISDICTDGHCCTEACDIPDSCSDGIATSYNCISGSCEKTTTTCDRGCNAANTVCYGSCANNNDCNSDEYCNISGSCNHKLDTGDASSDTKADGKDGSCLSGHSADGVCCENSCAGTCLACNLTGEAGHCLPVLNAADNDTCFGANSCDELGHCDLINGQECVIDGTTDCLSNNCVDGHCCEQASCANNCQNGQLTIFACGVSGQCSAITTTECPEHFACADTSNCFTGPCTADDDCVSDYFCEAGSCVEQYPQGDNCLADNQCKGALNCIDDHCCDSSACGTCESCDTGSCLDIIPGTEDPDTCYGEKICGDNGACVNKQGEDCTTDSDCITGHCADGVCCDSACDTPDSCADRTLTAYVCDTGTCQNVDSACEYGCNSENNACKESCASNSDCADGKYCTTSGTCADKLADGVASIETMADGKDGSCLSGHSADDICCDAVCTGTCMACNISGNEGHCTNQPAGNDDPDTCNGVNTCNNNGECVLKQGQECSDNAQCITGNCVDGHCCGSALCGTCESCESGSCEKLVAGNEDPDTCNSDKICGNNGDCVNKQGGDCSTDSDCITGFCVDGHCCENACDTPDSCDEGKTTSYNCATGTCEITTVDCEYGCNDTGNACKGNCADNSDCSSDKYCNIAGTCDDKIDDGDASSDTKADGKNGSCLSGHSADGLCCDTACAGLCQACDLSGKEGKCSYLDAGTEDPNGCNGDKICGDNGSCLNKQGAECEADSDCITGHCADGVCCENACDTADVCDSRQTTVYECKAGTGKCESAVTACEFGCNAAGNACNNSCSSNADCASGKYCTTSGTCADKKTNGETPVATKADGEAGSCSSGIVADGVCCNASCDGTCMACNLSGTNGTCSAVKSAKDADTCSGQKTCNTSGTCVNDQGETCSNDSDCITGHCADGVCCESACDTTDVCDSRQTTVYQCKAGTGKCESVVTACEFGCNAAGNACNTSCSSNSDCADGKYCTTSGTCADKKTNGETPVATKADGEAGSCSSGIVADGVCCNASCDGTCMACNLSGTNGTCSAVKSAKDADTCNGQKTCNTSGTCVNDQGETCSNDSDCITGHCADGVCCESTCDTPDVCDSRQTTVYECKAGTGKCESAVTACEFGCNAAGNACNTSCSSNSDCADGKYCTTSGTCADKKTNGETPVATKADGEAGSCSSGIVADGVCCNASCDGTCMACNLSGTNGTCSAVKSAKDADTCSGTKTCNTSGTCVNDQGETCSNDSDCITGHCADGVCCNASCDGTCMACNLSGTNGTCSAVKSAKDSDTCSGTKTCNTSGTCVNDQGETCSNDSDCITGHCADGVCCESACDTADICDSRQTTIYECKAGTGKCESAVTACEFGCNAAGNACNNSCSSNSDCADGKYCTTSGTCADKKTNGETPVATKADGEAGSCSSGIVADGVCCNASCDGTCMACNLSGTNGTCSAVKSAKDADTCNGTKTCNTSGTCVNDQGETCSNDSDCITGHCADGVCCESACDTADVCDSRQTTIYECKAGTGKCESAVTACEFGCNAAGTACNNSCSSNSDCADGKYCTTSGTCADKKTNGETPVATKADGEAGSCSSGIVADGVCCNASCDGTCMACNLSGTNGTCVTVTSSCEEICNNHTMLIVYECIDDVGCQYAAQNCPNNLMCNASNTACLTSCTDDDDCVDGYVCQSGRCEKETIDPGSKEIGEPCSNAEECDSGFCADGYCCESACMGECMSCGLVEYFSEGFCTSVMNMEDPDSCRQDEGFICGFYEACVYDDGHECNDDAECLNEMCINNMCVDSDGEDTCSNLIQGKYTSLDHFDCTTGKCEVSSTDSCAPYYCVGANGKHKCGDYCKSDKDCVQGYICDGGECVEQTTPYPRSHECINDEQCDSGYCTDGYCCSSRCSSICEDGLEKEYTKRACNYSGNLGKCMVWPSTSCEGYKCNSSHTACLTSCTEQSDCKVGYDCISGKCQPENGDHTKQQGQNCVYNSDCSTNYCVDSVCCDTPCDAEDSCNGNDIVQYVCNDTNHKGTCIQSNFDCARRCSTNWEGITSFANITCKKGVCSGPADDCVSFCRGNIMYNAGCLDEYGCYTTPEECPGHFMCTADESKCRIACYKDKDCVSGYHCVDGACIK